MEDQPNMTDGGSVALTLRQILSTQLPIIIRSGELYGYINESSESSSNFIFAKYNNGLFLAPFGC